MEKIFSATLVGYEADLVEIETDVSNGLPATLIVGLPDTMVQESRVRVRSALQHTSFRYPPTRVSINLAPSNLPKFGSHFDVAIALSILLAAKLIEFETTQKLFIGELSLDGQIRSGQGILAMVVAAKKRNIKEVFVPKANLVEAGLVEGISIYGVSSLNDLIAHLIGTEILSVYQNSKYAYQRSDKIEIDFADIAGQFQAKRALEIAAAGGHNLRMVGAPGSGKTMLAKALLGILPSPSREELLEITTIKSLAGELRDLLETQRPFRSPHHSASSVALIGGGVKPKPGEVSLAHHGVLFLDEFPEFPRQVLEVLRQPLEDGTVTIARAMSTVQFPANFMLIAAQNPCHCGNFGDPVLECRCHPSEVIKYNKKLSGPLLQRIDLHINVPRLAYKEFKNTSQNENSKLVRQRVKKARTLQNNRFGKVATNSDMSARQIKQYCLLDTEAEALLAKSADRFLLSGRSIHRLLKISRTIADLSGSKNILSQHLAESLQFKLET